MEIKEFERALESLDETLTAMLKQAHDTKLTIVVVVKPKGDPDDLCAAISNDLEDSMEVASLLMAAARNTLEARGKAGGGSTMSEALADSRKKLS